MRCNNTNKYLDQEWICFCDKSKSYKQLLKTFYNSWIYDCDKIRKKSENMSEEECKILLFSLEEEASDKLSMWKWSC